ncbi:MAG: hypothetical protein QXP01_01380 [Candidatus Hadarchaeum sp.]
MRGVLVAWLLFSLTLGALAFPEVDETECCPPRARETALEAWFHHNLVLLGLTYWPSNRYNLTVGLGGWGGAQLAVFLKTAQRVVTECVFGINFIGSFGVPLGGRFDWQRFEAGISLDACLPSIPRLSFELGIGVSLLHYLYCAWWGCEWRWSSGTFAFGAFRFHL